MTQEERRIEDFLGRLVCKKSKKPFKNGSKINMIVGVTTNPHTGKEAYELSDLHVTKGISIVDAQKCVFIR